MTDPLVSETILDDGDPHLVTAPPHHFRIVARYRMSAEDAFALLAGADVEIVVDAGGVSMHVTRDPGVIAPGSTDDAIRPLDAA